MIIRVTETKPVHTDTIIENGAYYFAEMDLGINKPYRFLKVVLSPTDKYKDGVLLTHEFVYDDLKDIGIRGDQEVVFDMPYKFREFFLKSKGVVEITEERFNIARAHVLKKL